MVFVKKRFGKKKVAKKAIRRVPRRRIVKRASGVPEWASLTEIMTLRAPGPFPVEQFVTNVMNQLYNVNLSLFARASAVAQNYQQFRVKNVKLIFKPLFDTYQAGAAGTVPYLYYLVDRTGSYQNITTVEQMKRMGAIGRRLDDRSVTINYRPSVLTKTYDNNDGALQNNQYRLSPWLSTNDNAPSGPGIWTPSGVDHLGIRWVAQQDGGSAPYRVEMQIEFQFKNALINTIPTNSLPVQDIFPDDTPNPVEDAIPPPS